MAWERSILDRLPSDELAEEAAAALRAAGIEVDIVHAAVEPHLVGAGQAGPKLVVRAEDHEDAWQVYWAWRESQGIGYQVSEEAWICQACDARCDGWTDTCWQCGAPIDPTLQHNPHIPVDADERARTLAESRQDAVEAIERIDARTAARTEEEHPAEAFSLSRLAFRFLVVAAVVWGLKQLLVWMAAR